MISIYKLGTFYLNINFYLDTYTHLHTITAGKLLILKDKILNEKSDYHKK